VGLVVGKELQSVLMVDLVEVGVQDQDREELEIEKLELQHQHPHKVIVEVKVGKDQTAQQVVEGGHLVLEILDQLWDQVVEKGVQEQHLQ